MGISPGNRVLILTNALTVAIPKLVQIAIDGLALGEGKDDVVPWVVAILLAGVAIMVVRTLSRTLFFNPGRTVEFRLKTSSWASFKTPPSLLRQSAPR